MNPRLIKYFLVTLGIIAAVLAVIFGSYQPFAKSQFFIKALRNQNNIKTFDQFKQNFDAAFNSPSQIGDEELAKFLSDSVISLISSQNQAEDVSRALVAYIEPHMFRNDVGQLLAYGDMRTVLFRRFHQEADLKKAEETYLQAFAIGPKLPPVLYSLLDLYSIARDAGKFKQTAETVLTYWPDDARLKSALTPVVK